MLLSVHNREERFQTMATRRTATNPPTAGQSGRGSAPGLTGASRGSRLGLPRMGVQRRQTLQGLLLVSPAMLFIATLFLVPMGMMVWMALNDWPLLGTTRFVGLANYQQAFGDD